MDTKAKAAVLVEPGHIETWEFDMPTLGKGAALCKVIRSGICGTDKHSFRGEAIQYKGTENEIHLPFPIIQGHEVLLEIVAIDEEGVTAASYIELPAAGAAMPPEEIIDFILDRPFLFVITNRYDLPLFAGVVNEP